MGFGRIRHTRDLESLLALVAGPAQAAVKFAAFVAAPSVFEGDAEGSPYLGDISLCLVQERGVKMKVWVAESLYREALHVAEGLDKRGAAVRINVVVTGVNSAGNERCVAGYRNPAGHGEHDCIAVRDHGNGHVFRSIVAVGYLYVLGEGRSREEASDAGDVHHVEGCPKSLGAAFGEGDLRESTSGRLPPSRRDRR